MSMRSLVKQIAGNVLAAAACVILAVPCGRAAAQTNALPAAHVTRCDLFSHGLPVGHGQIIRTPALRNGKPCTEVRLLIETHVNLLVYQLSMKMDESWFSDASGLIAYTWDSTENGKHTAITGELRDGDFRFEIERKGIKSIWTTPRASFDVAAISCQPGRALAAGETRKVRVLDPSTCTIAERTYRGTGTKMLTVGKRQIACDTVMIEYSGTHLQRWFISDEFGPLILQEDSDQKRGAYSRCAIDAGLTQHPSLEPLHLKVER